MKKQIQVAFAVNGLLDEEYQHEFAERKGPERIPELLAAEFKTTAELANEFLKPHIAKKLGSLSDVDELVERLEVVGEQVATKEVELEAQDRPDTKQVLREELERERAAKAELEKKLSQRRARRLRTYDCKNLLAESLRIVKQRLVIVSAFLSASVIDRWFLERLEGALKRGVKVWIAYGMGKEGDHARRRKPCAAGSELAWRDTRGQSEPRPD